jgi:predicted permease
MRALLEFLRRAANTLRRSRSDADLEEELRLHVELAAEREGRSGHAGPEAERYARLRAGNVTVAMDHLRDQRGLPWLDALRSDVVFGWRQIARHRIASIAAVLSLGLAMGAALAAFRLVDAVLLRPLPVADPSRLFVVSKSSLTFDQALEDRDDFDYPTFRRYRERLRDQADVMLLGSAVARTIVIDTGEPERAVQQFISGNVLPALGLQPEVGRLLTPADDEVPDGHPVVVISHDYWQRRFGADPGVLNRILWIGKRAYSIAGVIKGRFTGTEPGAVTDFFVPSMMNPEALNETGWSWFRIWLRPKAGIDRAQVQAVLQAGFKSDQAERVKEFAAGTPPARIDALSREQVLLRAAASGASKTQKAFRQPLWILAALAALLVLMACANVANLLLARTATRKIEMALRLSIGAARRRLVQLLLVESCLLAFIAAAVGALFASWAAPFIVSMLAPPEQPIRLILDVDWRTLLTGATLTMAVTMLFGLAPAIRGSATPLIDALKEVRGERAHRRLMDALVASQTAFCVFLLFGASLFLGTFDRLQKRPLGFTPHNLLQVVVDSAKPHAADEWAQLQKGLAEIPRVEAVGLAGWAPLTGNRWRSSVTVPGRPPQETAPDWVQIAPGYLEAMKMRLVEGRDFRAGERSPRKDKELGPMPGVAIVNAAFARAYFDGASPVGRQVTVNSSKAPMEIVGLVADTVYFSVREANRPAVYVPFESRPGGTLLIRAENSSLDLRQALRREIPRLIPGMQVQAVAPFEAIVTQQMIRERLLAVLSLFFAALALVLAVIGTYSVLNYAVTRERREIGLRMALGARPGHVVSMLTARLASMVLAGAVVGMGLGLAFGRYVETLLYQTTPTDLSALVPPVVALVIAAVLAVLPPAIRAVRTDPARTIRAET